MDSLFLMVALHRLLLYSRAEYRLKGRISERFSSPLVFKADYLGPLSFVSSSFCLNDTVRSPRVRSVMPRMESVVRLRP